MNLPQFGVKRPITTFMIFLGIFMLGAVAITKLSIDLLPEMNIPAISVITLYPGASAKDVESKVTEYIEDSLGTISNLDKILSRSKENLSIVTCLFKWGTNLDNASNDIRDNLELAKKDLPDDAERPIIFRFNTSMMPILVLGINAKESYRNLRHIIDKKLVEPLQRLEGVGTVQIMGGLEREIKIKINKEKIQAFNISTKQIIGILKAENLTLPAGRLKLAKTEYLIRVPGEFENIEEIKNIVIAQNKGALVYLKDVAEVVDSFKEITSIARVNGVNGLNIVIQKRSGANTVSVVNRINRELKKIKKSLPADIKIYEVLDTSDFIIQSMNNLKGVLKWGAIFVTLIVFFFLRRVQSSIIIVLTIPFSLIIAFILLYFADYTMNMMSISGLAIAMGMVVDNAIVILENIMRHVEKGKNRTSSAISGTKEVGLAVAASTLTTIVIFIPMIFLSGIVGIIFKQLASVISIVLIGSLFTALTLTPMLCSKFLKPMPKGQKKGLKGLFYTFSENIFLKIEKSYGNILKFALSHCGIIICITIIIFISSLFLIKKIGTDFMPEQDSSNMTITVELSEGTKLEYTGKISEKIEKIIKDNIPEMIAYSVTCGQLTSGLGSALGLKEGTNVIVVRTKLVRKNKRKRSTKEIAYDIRKRLWKVPGIVKVDIDPGNPIKAIVMSGGKPITINIKGFDIKKMNELAYKIKSIVETTKGTTDVSTTVFTGKPELKVIVNREKASLLGLNMAMIATSLRTYFYGEKATVFREKGDEYDIFLKLDKKSRRSIDDLMNISIRSLTGRFIKLKNIAKIVETTGPIEIERHNKERVVKVEANVFGRSLGEIASDIKERLKNLKIPSKISVSFGGDIEEQKKAFKDLLQLLLLGIALVYMVMASLFESFLYPFVIMFAIPFSFVGVIIAFFITKTTLSIITFIGVIMLLGIVVNNGIVLVDYINLLRKKGMNLLDAIVSSGTRRLRPVLMTSASTIMGLIPMIFTKGEGAEIWRPLGITVAGGLVFSTLVTFVLIPTLYFLFSKNQ